MKVVIYSFFGLLLYLGGEYFSKLYANNQYIKDAIISWILFSGVTIMWLLALSNFNKMALLSTIWNILYGVGAIGLALFIFHETLTSTQIIGCFFGLLAIIFLTI